MFRAHCVECHDLDGRGDSGRELARKIPDFTNREWHRARSDRDLARSIAVAWSGLVLVLSEASRCRDRLRIRMWFRLSLFIGAALVSVVGFTGGAVVFGLNHYAWPSDITQR